MSARTRVSVVDPPLVVQPDEREIERFAPRRPGELVRELRADARDRAEGRRRFEVVVEGWRFEALTEPAARAELRERAARAAAEHQPAAALTLRAQIPGRVVRVWVSDGDAVERGQRLLAIEAMKMENEIRAPHSGTVSAVRVAVGELIERSEELLDIV